MEIEARKINTILRVFRELEIDDQVYVLGKLQKIADEKDAASMKIGGTD